MSARTPIEEIFRAVKRDNAVRTFELIDSDESLLNATDANQNTPLVVALKRKKTDLAEKLIERGATPFIVSFSDDWGMQLIVERGIQKAADRERLVESCIAAGVWDVEIFHAVWRRDPERAEAILRDDPSQASVYLFDPVSTEHWFYSKLPHCGLTPLHYAVLAGDRKMVKLLLEAGAPVDAIPYGEKPECRFTPMMLVPNRCDPIAEMLVEYGANVRHTEFYLTDGSKSVRHVVVAHGAAGTPLMAALFLKERDKAAEIARMDPSVIHDRFPGSDNDTPLHMAVQAKCPEVIEALLDHGMDVDTVSSGGDTALTKAPECYAPLEIFELLVERGADVRAGGDSTIYGAVWQHAYRYHNYESVIRYLVAQGAKIRGFYHCADAGNLPAAKLLLELGADVNEISDGGWPAEGEGHTPLDFCTGVAGERKSPELAKLLLKNGGKHASELGDVS